ncbi:MAG: AMP-binding protein [Sneathiella sp.]
MTINLDRLWCEGIDDRPAVLLGEGRTSSRRELFAAAETLSRQIVGKRVAIFCASSEMEAIAFLAAMRVSAPVIFPAINRVEALREIRDAFDILLTDEETSEEISHISLSGIQRSYQEPVSCLADPIDPNLTMTFFTSGSTGTPKEIVKYFYQMDREIRIWERLMGAELKGTEVHATVSHQHIYGLLFRLLWPLCSGFPFSASTAKSWEEIAQQTENSKPFLLVSSPTHLSRMAPFENEKVKVRPVLTLSAGGVLHDEFAAKASHYLGRPVHEIYGSTETGAIARRFNKGEGESWKSLPGVTASQNERKCLLVQSAFLPETENVFQTEDLVVIAEDGSFTLHGRADRIVKIEGKRVSLQRMEDLLRKHNWIDDVYVTATGKSRSILVAAAVLNEEGVCFLSEQGTFRAGRVLKDHLKKFEDAVTAPRKWRFVNQIPKNPQGKTRAADIEKLFPDAGVPVRKVLTNTSFRELSCIRQGNTGLVQFILPVDLDFFKGHFTDLPVLPGVVQVHWAVQKSVEVFDLPAQPQKIEKLKFRQLMFPDTEATLFLDQKKPGKVHFLYYSLDKSNNRVEHSSGVLAFQVMV